MHKIYRQASHTESLKGVNMDKENFNFLIYRSAEENVSVNALIKDETIWLNQKAMAELFGVDVPAISKHLSNIYSDGELSKTQLFPKWK